MVDRIARIHEGSTGNYFFSPSDGPLIEWGAGFASAEDVIAYLRDDYEERSWRGDEMYTHYLVCVDGRCVVRFLGEDID